MIELTDKQKLAIYKKSQTSGYSIDILEEVYRRGYSIWDESFTGNAEQFGFDRINSFLAGGFATELDADLLEKTGLWANIHAKRQRIKAGSGEKMRKPGSKGAPTREAIKSAQNEELEQIDELKMSHGAYVSAMKRTTGYDAGSDEGRVDTDKLIARAKKNKGEKFANDLEGAHGMAERPNRNRVPGQWGSDKLAWRSPSKVTASGKANKSNLKVLKASLTKGDYRKPDFSKKKRLPEEYELEEAESALAKKAAVSGISIETLRKVYNRGMAAWRTGHRPGTTPQQWAMARVNSYISKGKGTYHGADKDLRESNLPSVPKDKETGLAKKYTTGEPGTDKARAAHFAKGKAKHWDDPSAYEPAPGDATAKTKESKYTKKARELYGEEYTGAEKVSKNKKDPSSRFDGTTSLTNVYKKDTPGQKPMKESSLSTIKRVISEATYKGKTVPLNKPMKGDVKKSKVYVDPDGDGKAQKVNFGDKNMTIKKNQPDRKASYCARSKPLGNDPTKANYWSRKAWDC